VGIFSKEPEEASRLREYCGTIAREYAASVKRGEPTRGFEEMTTFGSSVRLEVRRLYRHVAAVKSQKAADKSSIEWARTALAGTGLGAQAAEVVRSILEGDDEDDRLLSRKTPRDIPTLYPAFFERILQSTGHDATPENMANLIDRVAWIITNAGALAYFENTADSDARTRFLRVFTDPVSTVEHAHELCDDMIDWLWKWDPRCRKDLRERIPRIEEALTAPDSILRSSGSEVPPWNPP
jgi:hypothetical protein